MIHEILYDGTTQTLSWTADTNDILFRVGLSNATTDLYLIYEGKQLNCPLNIAPMSPPVEVVVKGKDSGGVWETGITKVLK